MPTSQQQQPELPKRLPLVIEPENRGTSTSFDARLVNCYMETKKTKESYEHWIYERPGLGQHSRPPAGNATGRGMFNWKGNVYSIFGDTLYKDGVAVVGTVDTTNGVYKFDSCLGATPKLQLGNGVKAYNYDNAGGLVLISDVDFPTSFVKGWAYLDGTTYVGRPDAGIQGSDTNDPVNWNALNVIIAQIEPDQGKALAKQLVYVVMMKEWSTEVFYDAANSTGSPLGRVEGAKLNYGCVNSDSVQDCDGALLWLSKTRTGPPEVAMFDNVKGEVVSSKAVERLLSAANFSTETVFSWYIKLNGHRFYVLTCKTLNLTLAFDIEERMWSQWTDTNGNYVPIVAACTDASLRNLVQHESNGRIYIVSDDYALDDTDLIQVDIYTPNFDGGLKNYKICKLLKLVTDQKAGAQIGIRVNDNDFDSTSWTNFRYMDLSTRDPMLADMGRYKKRAHNFRYKQPVRMPRITAVEMQVELGTL